MTKKHDELVEEIRIHAENCCRGTQEVTLCRACAEDIVNLILSAFRDGRLGQFREVLEKTEHELTTLHGLVVCDGFEAYHRAQRAGADPEGAWNSFVEETWQIDAAEILAAIKDALRPLTGTGREEEG